MRPEGLPDERRGWISARGRGGGRRHQALSDETESFLPMIRFDDLDRERTDKGRGGGKARDGSKRRGWEVEGRRRRR